jgi:hypothetical protein
MRLSYKSFAGRIVNELDIERTRAPQGSAFRWKKRNEEQDGQRRQLAELWNLAGKGRKRRKGGGRGGKGGVGRGRSTATPASSACSTCRMGSAVVESDAATSGVSAAPRQSPLRVRFVGRSTGKPPQRISSVGLAQGGGGGGGGAISWKRVPQVVCIPRADAWARVAIKPAIRLPRAPGTNLPINHDCMDCRGEQLGVCIIWRHLPEVVCGSEWQPTPMDKSRTSLLLNPQPNAYLPFI